MTADRAELYELYVEQGLSAAAVGARLGVTGSTVQRRLEKAGIPRRPNTTRTTTVEQRFWTRVQKTESCWIWTGGDDHSGYGHFYFHGRNHKAHRAAYEMFVGPIPDGFVIDHLCRNRACVNPAHLELVTNRENVLRGALGRLKTHCPSGHPYDEDNTRLLHRGHRICRTCRRERLRRVRAAS